MPVVKKIQLERRKVNEGLVQDVRDIKEMLVSMQRLESARVERENVTHEKLVKLYETVNGNGKVGLKTEIELLKKNEEKRAEDDKKRSAFQNTIMGAVIIQIVLLILSKVF